MRQRLGGKVAVQDVGRDRQAVGAGVIGNAGHRRRRAATSRRWSLRLPARQSPAVADERHGVEIADADHVGIERR